MKKLLIYILLIFNLLAHNKLEFTLENDILFDDKYYTNGVAWRYSKIRTEDLPFERDRTIWRNFIFGQKIYTPSDIRIPAEFYEYYDRPYAGWLYFGVEEEINYFKDNSVKYGIVIGFTGKESFAEEAQNKVHRLIGSNLAKGWSTQIGSMLGIQLNIDYQRKNYYKKINNNLDFVGDFKVVYEMGNVFFNVIFSEKIKLGKITPMPYLKNFSENEYYFFLEPKLMIDIYDATIEGELVNNNSLYTKGIYNLVGKVEAGIKYRYKNLTFEYSLNINSSELEEKNWKFLDHIYHKFYIDFYF